jgi:hypothetical protein
MIFSKKTGLLLGTALAGVALTLAGCGEPGAPQPPSLNLPQPVRNLSATRTGNTVHLAWTTTDRTSDHTTVTGTARTHICRIEGSGPCELVTDLPLKLGQPSQFDDTLPTDKLQGQPQLLTYYVELLNHARKSAGRSNAAYSASGQPVPELTALRVTVRPEGVELHWNPIAWPVADGAERSVKIVRTSENLPKQAVASGPGKSLLASGGSYEAQVQDLEITAKDAAGRALDRAIDRTARFGETYRYQVQGVEKLTLDGHAVELVSSMSEPAAIFTKDTFPPAVPQQLDAVADPASHAIDLSWSAGSEPDLAGYIVYRREAAGAQAERISGPSLLATPAFHDAQAKPGTAYAYSVSAVDQAGNESARSAEANEMLQPQ